MIRRRLRSPSYPSLTIDEAVERARKLFSIEGKHPALVFIAVSNWGYKQKSSGGLKTISTLKTYGLLTDAGSGPDRTVQLSDVGLTIVQDERQVSPERDTLIREAAFKPKIISDMWAKYGDSLPSLDTVKHYLVVDRNYNPSAFGDIIRSYKSAVSWRTKEISEDIDGPPMEQNTQAGNVKTAPDIPHQAVCMPSAIENEEIANIRVSRTCAIRLLADGQYNRKSIEALVAQLKLGLDLGTYDDIDDED